MSKSSNTFCKHVWDEICERCKRHHLISLVTSLAFATWGLLSFINTSLQALQLFEYGDESEKFVAAQMIIDGMRLYRDIFAHHGPVPYMVTHFYVAAISSSDFSFVRLFQVALALVSGWAILCSPVFKSMSARFWALGSYLLLLSSIWGMTGLHMLLYQSIGGFLFVIAVSQFVMPRIAGIEPGKLGSAASGLSLSFACLSAYVLAVPSLGLILAAAMASRTNGDIRSRFLTLFVGATVGVAIVLTWLLWFADLKGFLVYHLYFNQAVYANFIDYSPVSVLGGLRLSLRPEHVIHSYVLALFFLALLILVSLSTTEVKSTGRLRWCAAMGVLAVSVLFLNPRGSSGGIHTNSFLAVSLALVSICFGLLHQWSIEQPGRATAAGALFVVVLGAVSLEGAADSTTADPGGIRKSGFAQGYAPLKPIDYDVYGVIRGATAPDERILALVFNPIAYIRTGRLPTSGHFYYLPWQAAYNRNPLADHKIDICVDIEARGPRVIYFDDWLVWGRYRLGEYEPCVLEQLQRNYAASATEPRLFTRRN